LQQFQNGLQIGLLHLIQLQTSLGELEGIAHPFLVFDGFFLFDLTGQVQVFTFNVHLIDGMFVFIAQTLVIQLQFAVSIVEFGLGIEIIEFGLTHLLVFGASTRTPEF